MRGLLGLRAAVVGALRLVVASCLVVAPIGVATACGRADELPPPSTSTAPSAEESAPARPSAEDLMVPRTRAPVSSVSATVAVQGATSGIAIDHVAGEVFVTACRQCGMEPPASQPPAQPSDFLAVFESATAEATDEIPLATLLPGMYPRVVADAYAGLLYASRTGRAGDSISVIDTTSHEVSGTFVVDGQTLWGLAVDPTDGRIYAMSEGSSGSRPNEIVVIDGTTRDVVGRIGVDVDVVSPIAVDPVRGLVLVADASDGSLVVIDTAAGAVAATIQLVEDMAHPCENCLGYLGAPVVDPTTGLVYVSGPRSQAGGQDRSQALGRGAAGAVPAGGDTAGVVYVVDPGLGRVVDTVVVPAMLVWTRAGDPSAGAVYLSVIGGPTTGVRALDTATLELGEPIPVDGETTLAVDPTTGAVWVAGAGEVTVLR